MLCFLRFGDVYLGFALMLEANFTTEEELSALLLLLLPPGGCCFRVAPIGTKPVRFAAAAMASATARALSVPPIPPTPAEGAELLWKEDGCSCWFFRGVARKSRRVAAGSATLAAAAALATA